MAEVDALDRELNDTILAGKALEAFEQFYAEDVEMQDASDEPVRGKDSNRKREQEFFASVEAFHGAELLGRAVAGDRTYSEWMWDITLKGVGRMKWEQVSARTWRDGEVVKERFYYNKG